MTPGQLALTPVTAAARRLRSLIASSSPAARDHLAAGIIGTFSFVQRERCLANLRTVFYPLGWSEGKIRDLRRRHIAFLSRYLTAQILLPERSPEELRDTIDLEGREHPAPDAPGGALFIGSHLGDPWLLRAGLSAFGYHVANVSNRLPFRPLEEIFEDIRRRHSLTTVFVGSGATRTIDETISRNGCFSLSFDIATPGRASAAVPVPFGPAMMQIDLGPETYVLSHNVPVYWATIRSSGGNRYSIGIEPLSIDRTLTPRELAAAWADRLFRDLLTRPEEWWHWNNLRLLPRKPESGSSPHFQP
ncbi:MAG TPA: hypothetical protein VMW43_12915 [Bacteroidota bacterium]|nr:hypothetical protein [Bacteroidota bacterium]